MNNNTKIIAIGEILLDIFPNKKCLGGAPLNFVYHCKSLGLDAGIVSAVGKDDLGEEILARVQELDIDTQYIQKLDFETGTVSIELDRKGQPNYEIVQDVAWDNIIFKDKLKSLAYKTGVFYFGSLACRSEITKEAIFKFIERLPKDAIKICDINIRQNYYSKELILKLLSVANILKINDEEIEVLKGFFSSSKRDEKVFLKELREEFDLRLIILTRGSDGSLLFAKDEENEFVAKEITVKDTVGAGDSFMAASCYGILNDWTLEKINRVANNLAGCVCLYSGATPKIENIRKITEK